MWHARVLNASKSLPATWPRSPSSVLPRSALRHAIPGSSPSTPIFSVRCFRSHSTQLPQLQLSALALSTSTKHQNSILGSFSREPLSFITPVRRRLCQCRNRNKDDDSFDLTPSAPNPPSSMSSPSKTDEYRLPTNVRPTHYDLTLRTDLEKETFEGVVDVQCVFHFVSYT